MTESGQHVDQLSVTNAKMLREVSILPIANLVPNNWNPNSMDAEDIKSMSKHFRDIGTVDKPLTVRRVSDEQYEIVDGEQTYTAAADAGFVDLPCFIEELDDIQAMATTFVKNLHGKMNPLKVGVMIVDMKRKWKDNPPEGGPKKLTNTRLAEMMSKTEAMIRNYEIFGELYDLVINSKNPDSWPDDADLASLSFEEVKRVYSAAVKGALPQDIPELDRFYVTETEELAEHPPVGELSGEEQTGAAMPPPASKDEDKRLKRYVAAVAAIKKLDPDQRIELRAELGTFINEDRDLAKKAENALKLKLQKDEERAAKKAAADAKKEAKKANLTVVPSDPVEPGAA